MFGRSEDTRRLVGQEVLGEVSKSWHLHHVRGAAYSYEFREVCDQVACSRNLTNL